jgi:hypothetical protein
MDAYTQSSHIKQFSLSGLQLSVDLQTQQEFTLEVNTM